MEEIRFVRKHPWSCPSFNEYFIQDRPCGNDIHGHEAYEYALFRRIPFRAVKRFRTKKKAYEYVAGETGLTRWDQKMGCSSFVANDREHLGIIHGNMMYRIMKKTGTVEERPVEDEQVTGWYDRYRDCLSAAKEMLGETIS